MEARRFEEKLSIIALQGGFRAALWGSFFVFFFHSFRSSIRIYPSSELNFQKMIDL